MKNFHWQNFVGSLFFFAIAAPLFAANYTVDVFHSFVPATLQVNAGDSVTWINQDDQSAHTTTSDTGKWNSLLVNFQDQFTVQFNTVGSFPYHDLIDGFTGTISVVAANPPLSITLSGFKLLGGQFQFNIAGVSVGKTNFVQASTNLSNWISLRTNVATTNFSSFTDTQTPAFSLRFYRVTQLP